MPVIPIADQSQVQNAGNPVPIHSPGSAGMEGQSVSEFGAALAKYGDVLDKVAQHTAAESARIKMVDLSAQYKASILQNSAAQAAAAPIDGDKTGFAAAAQFAQNAGDVRDTMMKDMDPALQGAFKAEADKQISEQMPSVLATEVKKRAENIKPELGSAISSLSSIANADPSQLQYAMTKAEVLIQNSPDIPEGQKPQMIRNSKSSIVRDAVYGFAARGQWSQGQNLLNLVARDKQGNALDSQGNRILNADGTPNQQSSGIPSTPFGDSMDVKQREDLSTFLTNNQAQTLNRQSTAQNIEEKNSELQHKKTEQNLLNTYAASLQAAGNDPAARQPILDKIQNDVATSKIDEQKARSLINPTLFSKDADARYMVTLQKQLQLGEISPDDATNKVADDSFRANGGVSPEAAQEAMKQIQDFRRFQAQNPIFNSVTPIAKAKAALTDTMLDIKKGMSPAEQAAVDDKMPGAFNTFHQALASDPTKDMGKAAATTLSTVFGHPVDLSANSTPESVEKERNALAQTLSSTPNPSDTFLREYAARQRDLKLAKALMLYEKQSQKHQQDLQMQGASDASQR